MTLVVNLHLNMAVFEWPYMAMNVSLTDHTLLKRRSSLLLILIEEIIQNPQIFAITQLMIL